MTSADIVDGSSPLLAEALYGNEAEWPDELAFDKGDLLEVVDRHPSVGGGGDESSGWWLCRDRVGVTGIVPANRLALIPMPHRRTTPRFGDQFFFSDRPYRGGGGRLRDLFLDDEGEDGGDFAAFDDFFNNSPFGGARGLPPLRLLHDIDHPFSLQSPGRLSDLDRRLSTNDESFARTVPISVERIPIIRSSATSGATTRPKSPPLPPQRKYFHSFNSSDLGDGRVRSSSFTKPAQMPSSSTTTTLPPQRKLSDWQQQALRRNADSATLPHSTAGRGAAFAAAAATTAPFLLPQQQRHSNSSGVSLSEERTSSLSEDSPRGSLLQESTSSYDVPSHLKRDPASNSSNAKNESAVGLKQPTGEVKLNGPTALSNALNGLYDSPSSSNKLIGGTNGSLTGSLYDVPKKTPTDTSKNNGDIGTRWTVNGDNNATSSTFPTSEPSVTPVGSRQNGVSKPPPAPIDNYEDANEMADVASAVGGPKRLTFADSVSLPTPTVQTNGDSGYDSPLKQEAAGFSGGGGAVEADLMTVIGELDRAVRRLVHFAGQKNWRSPYLLQANLEDIRECVTVVVLRLEQLMDFCTAAKISNVSLRMRFQHSYSPLLGARKMCSDLRRALDACGWTLSVLSRRTTIEQQTASADNLDRFIDVLRQLPSDYQQLRAFVNGNPGLFVDAHAPTAKPVTTIESGMKRLLMNGGAKASEGRVIEEHELSEIDEDPSIYEDYDFVEIPAATPVTAPQMNGLSNGDSSSTANSHKLATTTKAPPATLLTNGNGSKDAPSPLPSVGALTSVEDRQIVRFYAPQIDAHVTQLNTAIEDFLTAVETHLPPKVFVSRGKLVILGAHKLVYIGDSLSQCVTERAPSDRVRAAADHLCDALKHAVSSTKRAAEASTEVTTMQTMVEAMVAVSKSAHQLRLLMKQLEQ